LNRKMKDSGVEWIGEIPEDVDIISNKYLFKYIKGKNPKEFNSEKRGLPYIGASDLEKDGDIHDYENYSIEELPTVEKDETLVLWDGARAGLIGIGHTGYIGSTIVKVIPRVDYVDKKYWYWYLKGFQPLLLDWVGGTTIPHMNRKFINEIKFINFPLSQQKSIANFLDEKTQEIDNIISKTKKAIEEYKRYKQSLITETVTKGLDENVEMKDSGIEWIGEIPEHWRITRLKYYLENVKNAIRVGPFGSHLKGEDFVNEGLWVYNQRTVLDRNFETNDTFITAEKYNDMIGFGVEAKDILVTTRGSIGKICRVPEQFEKGIIHPCIIKFKLDDSKFNYRILELIFNESDFVRKQFVILSNSTTIDVIYSETLKNILVPAIPINEQKAIVSYLDKKCSQIDQIISSKEKLLREMEAYKKSLIYETVTGKREVE